MTGNLKVYAVIKYIKSMDTFSFDILDVLEAPHSILEHYGIFVSFNKEEIALLQKDLMRMAEQFQSSEIVRLYGKQDDLLLIF